MLKYIIFILPLGLLSQQLNWQNNLLSFSSGTNKEVDIHSKAIEIDGLIFDLQNSRFMEIKDSFLLIEEETESTRWLSLDPLATKYPNMSPYNFVANTPIQAIDPDGKIVIYANDEFTQAKKAEIEVLKANSPLFKAIMNYLEKSPLEFSIEVNDVKLDMFADQKGQYREAVLGATNRASRAIYFRANANDKALIEEPFHQVQGLVYGADYSKKSEIEIEAEAKLVDYVAEYQSLNSKYGGRTIAGPTSGEGEDFISTIGAIDNINNPQKILEKTGDHTSYLDHLNYFKENSSYANSKSNEISNGTPDAYNKMVDFSSETCVPCVE